MTDGTDPHGELPCYEVSLAGRLDVRWSTWFGGPTITHEDDGTTTLRAVVADQADLHGLLAKVRDLGATLISLTLVDPAGPPGADRSVDRVDPLDRRGRRL